METIDNASKVTYTVSGVALNYYVV